MSKPERIFTGNVNIDTTKAISVNDFNLLKAKGVIKVEKKASDIWSQNCNRPV